MSNNKNLQYEKQLISFIDILGFKEIVKNSENDPQLLKNICETIRFLKKWEKPTSWNLETIEIEEDAQLRGLDSFNITDKSYCTCFSDSIIVSVKIATGDINALFSTLVANLALMGANLAEQGIFIRGAITIGNLIHENDIIIGQGLIDAYNTETKLANFPRIVISEKLLKELIYPLETKSNRYPYHLYLTRDKDGCVGFHQLKYFEVIQASPKNNILKASLDKIRKEIIKALDSSFESPSIYQKYQWLKDQYNNNLFVLSEDTKLKIMELNEGIAGNNIHYSYTDDFYYKNKLP